MSKLRKLIFDILLSFISVEEKSKQIETIADNHALGFSTWLMENCELADDNSLWSYESEDYSMEGLLTIYKSL